MRMCKNECIEQGDSNCKYYNIAKGSDVEAPPTQCTMDLTGEQGLECLRKGGDTAGFTDDLDKNYFKCFMTNHTNTTCGQRTSDYINLCDSIFENKKEKPECWKDMTGKCVDLTEYVSNSNSIETDTFNQLTIVTGGGKRSGGGGGGGKRSGGGGGGGKHSGKRRGKRSGKRSGKRRGKRSGKRRGKRSGKRRGKRSGGSGRSREGFTNNDNIEYSGFAEF